MGYRIITKDMRDTLRREAIVVRPDGTWTTLAQHMDASAEMSRKDAAEDASIARQ